LIITNNSLRPSERFLQVILDYLLKDGYTFKKNKKSFEKPFDKGNYIISFDFRIGMLTSVTFSWHLFFENLAKVNSIVNGNPKIYKRFMYMPTSLATHTRWEQNFEYSWNLYDEYTSIHTDKAINLAAEQFIKAYELYVPAYFNYFGKYESLESDYNRDEFKSVPGLLLAKYLDNPNFNTLLETFERQINIRENDILGEEHQTLERLKNYFQHNDIKKNL
jgi:hypothetical protein